MFTVPVPLCAQSVSDTPAPTSKPAFEVASIKPNLSQDAAGRFGLPAGRFTAANMSLKEIIKFAYNGNQGGFSLREDQVSGGPSWIDSDKFDIDAKVEDSFVEVEKKVPVDEWMIQIRLMLQSLLEDRFKLKVSHATKELPVYALVVAKNGPKLIKSDVPPIGPPSGNPPSGSPPRKGPYLGLQKDQIISIGMPIDPFAEMLSRQPEVGGRMVLNETGLNDRYDFTLHWTPEIPATTIPEGQTPPSQLAPDSSAPSLFTALQEQLGLRLESTKAPVDVLVIDYIEKPSPN